MQSNVLMPEVQMGIHLGLSSKKKVVMTDASNSGWGTLYEGRPASENDGSFSGPENLPLSPTGGHHILVCSENMTVMAFINHKGGLRSWPLYKMVKHLFLWAQCNLRSLRAVRMLGIMNQVEDFLS